MRTDGHDEANSRISQSCERAYKWTGVRSFCRLHKIQNGKIILLCPFAHSFHLQNYSVDFDKML
jgi:hypothetical protein